MNSAIRNEIAMSKQSENGKDPLVSMTSRSEKEMPAKVNPGSEKELLEAFWKHGH
jgi:hypothetical protein